MYAVEWETGPGRQALFELCQDTVQTWMLVDDAGMLDLNLVVAALPVSQGAPAATRVKAKAGLYARIAAVMSDPDNSTVLAQISQGCDSKSTQRQEIDEHGKDRGEHLWQAITDCFNNPSIKYE